MIACVFLVLMGLQTHDISFSVPNTQLGEVQLLQRYADMTGHKGRIGFVMSLGVTPLFEGTDAETKALLNSFNVEYGVDFLHQIKNGWLKLPFPKFKVVTNGKTTLGMFVGKCSSTSLVGRALTDAIHSRQVTLKASMVSLSYIIRPWISDKLTRTELLHGTLVVRSPKGQVRDVYLMYSP